MDETKLVCDIMSTIACHILNNPSKDEAKHHLIEMFYNSSLQHVNIDEVVEHMEQIKCVFSK